MNIYFSNCKYHAFDNDTTNLFRFKYKIAVCFQYENNLIFLEIKIYFILYII